MLDSEGCQALHVALRDSLREGIGAIVCRSLLLLELFDCLRELGGLNAGAGDEVLTTEKSGSAPGWANAARGAVKAMTRPANTAIATGTPVGAPLRSSGASAEAGVNDFWLRGGVTETKLREPAARKLADKAARSAAERTMASGRAEGAGGQDPSEQS